MKKILKVVAILIGALAGLFVLTIIALPFIFDPNDYKDDITKAAKDQTGRELTIAGDIGLSLFPWVGMKIGHTTLGNAAGFGNKPFASMDSVDVNVAVIPLFSKKVVVKNISLDGLRLNLMINSEGKSNWDDLAQPSASTAETQPATTPAESASVNETELLSALSIGGINISSAEVIWDDKAANTFLALHAFNFKTGRIESGKPITIAVNTMVESRSPAFQLPLTLDTTLNADLAQQTLDIARLKLKFADLSLNANLKGNRILDAPEFSGKLSLTPFNLAAFLKQIGIEVSFSDNTALTRVSLQADIAYDPNRVETNNLQFNMDDTVINGKFRLQNFDNPRYDVTVAIDNLDVDRYLPPASDATSDTAETDNAGTGADTAPPSLAPLRNIVAKGKLDIGKLKVAGLKLNDISVTLNANGGLVKLDSIKAQLYEGATRGSVVVDARGRQPLLKFAQSLKGVQIGPVLKDMDLTNKFNGKGNVNIDLNTKGLTQQSIANNLNGTLSFSLRDGEFKGVNFIKMAREGRDKFNKFRGKTVSAQPKTGDATVYSKISGTAKVAQGLARNNDFIMQSSQGNITGKGEADLGKDRIKYRVEVKEKGSSGKAIPILVYGKLSAPKFKLDLSQMTKQAVKKKKAKVKRKAEEQLKEKAKEKLKGLFGR